MSPVSTQPEQRETDMYELGTRMQDGEPVPNMVELYLPNEAQIATMLRVKTWLEAAEEQSDSQVGGRLVLDAVNTFLTILDSLFVDREQMVRAWQVIASGDTQAYERYALLAEAIIKRHYQGDEQPARPTNRATKRAAARRR